MPRANGDLSGLKFPNKVSRCTVPLTLLPMHLFDKEITKWRDIKSSRWTHTDHITRGEGRAVMKLLMMLSSHPQCHNSKAFSWQDNRPICGAFSKGRSPSPAVNFLARRKAGHCFAAGLRLLLPWVQTDQMPADDSSRRR